MPATSGECQQGGEAGQHRAQPAVRPALMLGLVLGFGTAFVEEGTFELVEVALVGRGPVERRGEPRAAVELAGIAATRLPLARRLDQVLVEAATLGVLLEPCPKPRPLAQQRLVSDLDGPLICGHEPAVR